MIKIYGYLKFKKSIFKNECNFSDSQEIKYNLIKISDYLNWPLTKELYRIGEIFNETDCLLIPVEEQLFQRELYFREVVFSEYFFKSGVIPEKIKHGIYTYGRYISITLIIISYL